MKKENFKYLIKTDRGRQITVDAGMMVPSIDETTFEDIMIHPEECAGRYLKITKPIPVTNRKKTCMGVSLGFRLGHLIGITCLRTSYNHIYPGGLFLYLRGRDLREYFISRMTSKFDDFSYEVVNHYRFESANFDRETTAIGFKSDKFFSIMRILGIEPRKKITPNCINRLSMKFRMGMLLGMFDANAYYEIDPCASDGMRHIRLLIKDWHEEYCNDLFTFTDYLPMDFYLENYYDGNRVKIACGDIDAYRWLLLKGKSYRTIEFAKKTSKFNIARATNMVPITKEIYQIFRLWGLDHGRNYIHKEDGIMAINTRPRKLPMTENAERWQDLVLDKHIRLERYRRPIKIGV